MRLKKDRNELNSIRNAALALSIGALLGVLATMPYEQLIGLSGETCIILRSLVSTAVLAGFGTTCVTRLTFDVSAWKQETTDRL
jgi:hypothetical protein